MLMVVLSHKFIYNEINDLRPVHCSLQGVFLSLMIHRESIIFSSFEAYGHGLFIKIWPRKVWQNHRCQVCHYTMMLL